MPMLYDEIMTTVIQPGVTYASAYRLEREFKASQRFMVERDFAQVADELAGHPADIVKMLPFCRLPAPSVWIEAVHSDRLNFLYGAPVAEYESKPHRVGFLLVAENSQLSQWKTHLFWNFPGQSGVHSPGVAMRFNTETGFKDRCGMYFPATESATDPVNKRIYAEWMALSEADRDYVSSTVHPTAPNFAYLFSQINPDLFSQLVAIGTSDWGGEVAFIQATLGLLNSRNTIEVQYVNNEAYSQKRIARGRAPLTSYNTVRIHSKIRRRVNYSPTDGYSSSELRRHFVRGHWKVRKSGIFFWKPFYRGKGDSIEHGYKLID